MLEIGNGEFAAEKNALWAAQTRSHYSLWAAMKAPMLLGADLSALSPQTLAILNNAEAIGIIAVTAVASVTSRSSGATATMDF